MFQSAQHIVLGLSPLRAILVDFDPSLVMASCEFAGGKLPSKRNKVDEDFEQQAEEKDR